MKTVELLNRQSFKKFFSPFYLLFVKRVFDGRPPPFALIYHVRVPVTNNKRTTTRRNSSSSRLGHRWADVTTTVSQTLWCSRVSERVVSKEGGRSIKREVKKEEAEQKGSQKVFQYKRRPVPKEFLGIKELKHSVNCRNRTPSRKSIRNSTAAAAGRPTPLFLTFSFFFLLCNTPATTYTYVRQNPLLSSSSSIPF